MKADTWQRWGAEAHALNELSFLRGFGIAGAYLLPCASSSYLPPALRVWGAADS